MRARLKFYLLANKHAVHVAPAARNKLCNVHSQPAVGVHATCLAAHIAVCELSRRSHCLSTQAGWHALVRFMQKVAFLVVVGGLPVLAILKVWTIYQTPSYFFTGEILLIIQHLHLPDQCLPPLG